MSEAQRYRTPTAFRSAVESKLRERAKHSARPFAELRREFLYQRFLARVFSGDSSPWVLKGGVGLLTRLPGARHSRDIDLLHLDADTAAAEVELRQIGRQELGDYLRFEVRRSIPLSAPDALRLKMDSYTGSTVWENFDIDVSCERHFVADVQSIQPTPIVEIADLPNLPTFQLYPLVDQVADKVAAMYEKHGSEGMPSSRYRDLVDLALLITIEGIDAALLVAALDSRQANARNPVTLPSAMHAPGRGWSDGYRAVASRTTLDRGLHHLETALSYVGACLNPVLDRRVTSGHWNPTSRSWT